MQRIRLDKKMGSVIMGALVIALVVGYGVDLQAQSKPWPAKDWKPPFSMVVRCSSVGGTGYAMTNAMVVGIEKETGVRFAAPPTDDTLAQFMAIKKGQAFSTTIMADEIYLALEGKMMFKDAGWPPQSIRMIWFGNPTPQGWLTKNNSGIKTLNDMVGKKVTQTPPGSQDELVYNGLFAYTEAHPDYVHLSWKNLKPVPVAEFDQGQDALLSGAADVAIFSANSSTAREAEASPGGIHWIPLPNKTEADKKAWAAFQKVVPCYAPSHWEDTIPGTSKMNPADIWAVIYHWVSYDFTDENTAYWLTMQIDKTHNLWKDKHPQLKHWNINFALSHIDGWFAPWHEGSIRYFKDIGRWTPAMQAKQEEMLKKYPQKNTK